MPPSPIQAEKESFPTFDSPTMLAARAECLRLALQPVPEDRYAWDAWNMACVHTVVFNRLEASYKNATHIAPGDLANYIAAAKADVGWLLEHHVSEEEFYFPFFPPSTNISTNVSEHDSFHSSVTGALSYLSSVDPSQSSTFSPSQFRELIDAFLPPLATHLTAELETLSALNLKASGMTIPQLEAALASVQAHRAKDEDAFLHGAATFGGRPEEMMHWPAEGGWVLEWVMIPLWRWWVGGRLKYVWSEKRWERTPANEVSGGVE